MDLISVIRAKDFKNQHSKAPKADDRIGEAVSRIIERVKKEGDKALFRYSLEFDNVRLSSLRVGEEKIKAAGESIDSGVRKLLEETIGNIQRFHCLQTSESWMEEFEDGSVLGEVVSPIDRAGIYVPGGKAFYPSTMIMNVVPAQIAEVPSIMIASPPGKNGLPHELVLAVASVLGVKEVYAIGGAQAVAAMAWGTESIRPACKITGPGNRYVAEAKRQVFGRVGIDSVAGPSEIVILHDDPDVPLEYLVRDLLTQAEHDEEAKAILITSLPSVAEQVRKRLEELVPTLPRKDIIAASLRNNGQIILIENIDQGFEIVNGIAPEHLELLLSDPENVKKVRNAGAVFVGKWSTETIGDYFAGPNHTIPTGGAARYSSPLSVRDFQKHSSLIKYSEKRLFSQAESIIELAELEGLHAHAASVRERISKG